MFYNLLLSKFLSKINKLSAIIQLPQNSISLNFTNKQKHDKNNLFCKSTEHQKLFKRTINPNCTDILCWNYGFAVHYSITKFPNQIFFDGLEREREIRLVWHQSNFYLLRNIYPSTAIKSANIQLKCILKSPNYPTKFILLFQQAC